MTKSIRIENADTSDHKVIVECWIKQGEGKPDVLESSIPLDYPTALTTQTIWGTKYLVVREA